MRLFIWIFISNQSQSCHYRYHFLVLCHLEMLTHVASARLQIIVSYYFLPKNNKQLDFFSLPFFSVLKSNQIEPLVFIACQFNVVEE